MARDLAFSASLIGFLMALGSVGGITAGLLVSPLQRRLGLGGTISLAVTLLRREQSKRRMAARIAGRLATFAGGPEGSPGDPAAPRSAERGPSTIRSA